MQKPNEMTTPKNECNTARRALLKNTASVAGLATIAPAISFASGDSAAPGVAQMSPAQVNADQHHYIVSVLNKYAAKSKRVTPEHIDRFATGFIEMNGNLNYKEAFNRLDGEYKLVKLFMKSFNASV